MTFPIRQCFHDNSHESHLFASLFISILSPLSPLAYVQAISPSPTTNLALHHLFLIVNRTLLLALMLCLCTCALRSHTELRPSATPIISLATRSASLLSLRLSALPRIHCIAVRRRCWTPRGTGMGRLAPPPITPRCWRILTSGATLSIAAVRYAIGESGRIEAGAVVGRRGFWGEDWGGGAVRSVSRIMDMF